MTQLSASPKASPLQSSARLPRRAGRRERGRRCPGLFPAAPAGAAAGRRGRAGPGTRSRRRRCRRCRRCGGAGAVHPIPAGSAPRARAGRCPAGRAGAGGGAAGALGQEAVAAPLAQEVAPPSKEGGGGALPLGPRYRAASRGGRGAAGARAGRHCWACGCHGNRPPLGRRGRAAQPLFRRCHWPAGREVRTGGALGRPAVRRGPPLPLAGRKRSLSRLAAARCQSGRCRGRPGAALGTWAEGPGGVSGCGRRGHFGCGREKPLCAPGRRVRAAFLRSWPCHFIRP